MQLMGWGERGVKGSTQPKGSTRPGGHQSQMCARSRCRGSVPQCRSVLFAGSKSCLQRDVTYQYQYCQVRGSALQARGRAANVELRARAERDLDPARRFSLAGCRGAGVQRQAGVAVIQHLCVVGRGRVCFAGSGQRVGVTHFYSVDCAGRRRPSCFPAEHVGRARQLLRSPSLACIIAASSARTCTPATHAGRSPCPWRRPRAATRSRLCPQRQSCGQAAPSSCGHAAHDPRGLGCQCADEQGGR